MELKKEGSWETNYENVTQGFIVSKCYVIKSNIAYHCDGGNVITHKVVFPFDDISGLQFSIKNDEQNIGKENRPCNIPYPVSVVTDLFDSYDDAKIASERKNEEYRYNLILDVVENPNWKEQFENLKQKFAKRLELCYLFEKLLLEKTKDMKITELQAVDKEESYVIILKPSAKQIS